MSQQTVNIGSVHDDGTGDPLRTAFDKLNQNCTELYTLYNTATLYSDNYGFVGDGTTDNATAFANLLTAANAAKTAGMAVTIVFRSATTGNLFATTSRNITFDGDFNVDWGNVWVYASGTDVSNPLFIRGTSSTRTRGWWRNFRAQSSVTGHQYLNRNYVAVRNIGITGSAEDSFQYIQGFTVAWQYMAQSSADAAYCIVRPGDMKVCKYGIDFCSSGSSSVFAAETKVLGGNFETTSSMNDYGHCFAVTFTRQYDTDYASNSGNVMVGMSVQPSGTQTAYPTSGSVTSGKIYQANKIGGEWLCKTSGTTSSTQLTAIPTPVSITSGLATTSGSNVVTCTNTSSLSTGMHVRTINPLDNFPVDTYVGTITANTSFTTVAADGSTARNATTTSSTVKAVFTPVSTDNTAEFIYLGPANRGAVWLRDCGRDNSMIEARCEGGLGAAVVVSGPHMWPESSTSAGPFKMQAHTYTATTINRCFLPLWAAGTAYTVGQMVRRAAINGYYWECITAGTSHASTEPTPTEAKGLTFTDNTVTWICRTIPLSNASADWEEFTGGQYQPQITCVSSQVQPVQSATLPPLTLAICGDDATTSGWRVPGWSRGTTGGTSTSELTKASFGLAVDGLILKSTSELIGFYIRTDTQKCFEINKVFGRTSSSRVYYVALDANLRRLPSRTAANSYRRRLLATNISQSDSTNTWNEANDTTGSRVLLWVADEVKAVYVGFAKGSSGSCVLGGASVKVLPSRLGALSSIDDAAVQVFQLNQYGLGRSTLSTPVAGFFRQQGEIISNAAVKTGGTVPHGYQVATGTIGAGVGALAPAWVTGTAYIEGELVSNSSNVFAANCSFTSGTAPTGTNDNILDGTATGVQSGRSATWTQITATATLNALASLA